MSHNHAGEGPARFTVELTDGSPDFYAGPVICYEDIFPDFVHDVARQDGGVDVFVNVTIDTWFGDTAEPWEHLALAQYRSVEHRIPMVRSVAAGTSSVVDTAGRVAAALPVRAPDGQRTRCGGAPCRRCEAAPQHGTVADDLCPIRLAASMALHLRRAARAAGRAGGEKVV